MTDSTFDLDKLERLEREATPGPWELEERAGGHGIFAERFRDFGLGPERVHGLNLGHVSDLDGNGEANLDLLIALRNAAPAMIAELRAARERIAELEEHISALECIAKAKGGVTLDEPREVPAEVEFDAEEITRIADAAVDRIVREHFPDLDKLERLEREAAIYGAVFANAYPHVSTRVAMSHAEDAVEAWRAAQKGGDDG